MSSRVFGETEINDILSRELPTWHLQAGSIRRTYRTSGWRATLMVVNAIGHLAEAAWHHPDLAVSYAKVTVSLNTHDAGGITDKDFELARKIEELILWQPGLEGKALEGVPGDHEYIDYAART